MNVLKKDSNLAEEGAVARCAREGQKGTQHETKKPKMESYGQRALILVSNLMQPSAFIGCPGFHMQPEVLQGGQLSLKFHLLHFFTNLVTETKTGHTVGPLEIFNAIGCTFACYTNRDGHDIKNHQASIKAFPSTTRWPCMKLSASR